MPQILTSNDNDPLIIAGQKFNSRLLVGTGRYDNWQIAKQAIGASNAEIVTVALRRAKLNEKAEQKIQNYIDPNNYTYLPNSAGCYTAEEAVRTFKLAREIGNWNLIKLEVIGDKTTLLPNMKETLKAAEFLVKDNFDIMVYCTAEPNYAKTLEQIGCKAIMPLAAPIGSGLGIQSPNKIKQIVQQSNVPVLIDAGIGTASDACIAMELGCDGVLLNTAIAKAKNPSLMAKAMKNAVISGRQSYLAGRIPKRNLATPSSPTTGVI